jgi:hypothetical protein
MCCGRVIDSCVTDKKKPYASCCKLSLTWTERGILQIRGTFPKTIGWHIPKNLPHTSNKRFLISIPLFSHYAPCKRPPWSCSYGSSILQLSVQSVTVTTTVESLNTIHGEVYPIQHYAIKFVSYLRQVGGFLRVIRFPPPIKLTVTI